MNPRALGFQTIGGRWGRGLGLLLLANFAALCAIKLARGRGVEIWWMSHVGLLLAGLGLVGRSTLTVAAALTCILLLHAVWLFDCIGWLLFGAFPLGLTGYLEQADLWAWVTTAHHFYLTPLLVVVTIRHGTYPAAAWPAATAVYLVLTLVSRAALSPAQNVNWAFGLEPLIARPLVDRINALPGGVYLLGLNAVVSVVIFLPTVLIMRRAVRHGGRSCARQRDAPLVH